MAFTNNPGSGNTFQQGTTSDKLYLSWRINNAMNLLDMTNAMGDKMAVVRMIKQLHYLIRTIWDDSYVAAYRALQDRVNLIADLTPGLADDELAYDAALRLMGEQMSCLGRNNMLPLKDVETVVGAEESFFIKPARKQVTPDDEVHVTVAKTEKISSILDAPLPIVEEKPRSQEVR